MKTCDTCKHWQLDGRWPGMSGGAHCKGYRVCMSPKIMDGTPAGPDGAFVGDGDYASSSGWFETGPKFGCIHQQPI